MVHCVTKVNKEKFFEAPAYASKIIDKVGAGDALLSIFSLCIYSKIPIDLSLFLFHHLQLPP